ncbi:hypothetical protein [Bradyrhizobium sp. 5.13L]
MIVSKGTQPAFRSLEPGDPWTMILERAIWFGPDSDGRAAAVGDMIRKWFATNEPGRIFRITAVHGFTYETVFVGFEQ